MAVDPVIRFTDKINPDPDTGCWFWAASLDGRGYGQFVIKRGKIVRAHRLSYEIFVGPIPEGLDLDHLCREPRCVNPDHLEPVTRAENVRRGLSVTKRKHQALSLTHCPNGHEYAIHGTTYFHKSRNRSSRKCTACERDRLRRCKCKER